MTRVRAAGAALLLSLFSGVLLGGLRDPWAWTAAAALIWGLAAGLVWRGRVLMNGISWGRDVNRFNSTTTSQFYWMGYLAPFSNPKSGKSSLQLLSWNNPENEQPVRSEAKDRAVLPGASRKPAKLFPNLRPDSQAGHGQGLGNPRLRYGPDPCDPTPDPRARQPRDAHGSGGNQPANISMSDLRHELVFRLGVWRERASVCLTEVNHINATLCRARYEAVLRASAEALG